MTRYFYTDPLAAAWMLEHHGARIQWQTKAGLREIPSADQVLYQAIKPPAKVRGCPKPEKYYMHPVSFYLLEPILSDVIWVVRDGFYEVRRIRDAYDKQELKLSWKLHKIIERNGIAFMWPESETA